jgi:peptide/nickel transport system permease protein
MLRYALTRLAMAAFSLLLVGAVVFLLIRSIPGDPALLMLGDSAEPAQLADLRRQLGLDRPLPVQFAYWLGEMATGDLGQSLISREPVLGLLWDRFSVTATIVLSAVALAALIAVPAGMLAAWRQNRWQDLAVVGVSTALLSIPSFWLGMMLLLLFGIVLQWVPVVGYVPFNENAAQALKVLALPVATLVLVELGTLARMARASTLDVLQLEYIAHARAKGPSAAHWLGTDDLGRDVLSRALAGAASSVTVSVVTVLIAVLLGAVLGTLSGFLRGWFDQVAMTFNDVLLAFPGLLFALAIMATFGPSRWGVIFALALAFLPSVVRVVRGTVLSLREKEFIDASRVMGNSPLYTLWRHVLPGCIPPLTVLTTAMFGWVLLSESALSFLGLGVPPPAPTWGGMLSDSRAHIDQAPWLAIFPGLCISLALLGVNLFGDAMRDWADPRMEGR